jgi:hypothetical protein
VDVTRTGAPHGGGGGYAKVVGKMNHEIVMAGGNPHARLALDVGTDSYEADINTHSTDGSNVQYLVRDSKVADAPKPGAYPSATFSYDGEGLKQADFKSVGSDEFHNDLVGWAKSSYLVEMNGMTYSNGGGSHGIHDIHQNSGEPAGSGHSNEVNKDGYAAFYTADAAGGYDKKEVFVKFAEQGLKG